MKNDSHNKILIALLAASCLISNESSARRLVPESPSVEVRLEALRILQNSAYDDVSNVAPVMSNQSATPFKPAVNYVPPAPIIALKPAVVAPKPVAIAPKPKAAPVVVPTPIIKVEEPKIELPKIEKPKVEPKIEPLPIIAPKPVESKEIDLPKVKKLEIEDVKVEPLKVEPTKIEEPKIELPESKAIPLPLEIIEEKSDEPAQTIGEELSLDELLKEEAPKVEEPKVDKVEKVKAEEKISLPEPEIPELEKDFADMAKNNDMPLLPKEIVEKPKDIAPLKVKTEEKPFDELPPVDMPLELPEESPEMMPEIKEETVVVEKPVAPVIEPVTEEPKQKKGILPNLSGGFASFLGKPKQQEVAKPQAVANPDEELPNLPEFNEPKPPVDEPLPPADFSENEENNPKAEDLPSLPTFGSAKDEAVNNAPLPTLPFGEKPRLPEQQIASLPKNELPQMAENKGNALSISFSQSETEVPLAAQKSLIALAKDLVANESKNVKITAYASGSEDQVSVARRISLARALAVRAFMIDLGVPNTSISVKAMGNDIESGSPERADITVN